MSINWEASSGVICRGPNLACLAMLWLIDFATGMAGGGDVEIGAQVKLENIKQNEL